MHAVIDQHRAEILAIAQRHGLRDVRVFGSMARGDAGDDSDVDLLVSLPPERTGLALGALLVDVQDLLHRRVDVVTEKSLHPLVRDRIEPSTGCRDKKPADHRGVHSQGIQPGQPMLTWMEG